METLTGDRERGKEPKRAGCARPVVSVGLGVALGTLAGIVAGAAVGIGISLMLSIL